VADHAIDVDVCDPDDTRTYMGARSDPRAPARPDEMRDDRREERRSSLVHARARIFDVESPAGLSWSLLR